VRSPRLNRIEAAAWKLASRKWACIVAFTLIPLGARLALLPWIPAPQPGIQDEFSYLLASDTFASGRLTNPPHRFWVFFESVHILQQPTYMSKYPPLTGLILAFGQTVFGHPWIGILVSMAVLCGTLAWAMQNWMPPFWALAGTALAVLKVGILSYWSESYWGGTGAAIGGTLLIGSLPGIIRRPTCLRGLAAAIGIALLANSRPFEGLLLTMLCLGYAAWRIIRAAPGAWLQSLSRGIFAPLLIVLVPVGAWMAFYNFRVTGSAVLMPYVAHERQYAVASAFFWMKPSAPPVYRHEALRQTWLGWDLRRKDFQRDHFFLTRFPSFASLEKFYLGVPLFIVIVVCAPAIVKSRRTRAAFWLLILFLGGLGLELEFIPHYAAPAIVLLYIVAAAALRSLRHWRTGGPWMAPAVYGAVLIGITAQLSLALFQPEHRYLYDKRDFQAERARMLAFLSSKPGKQLVFVRYGPQHDVNHEWVYNRADIDGSNVVWARSMGRDKDRTLIAYFKNRRVWILDENGPAQVAPYDPGDHSEDNVSNAARSPGR
jgi:hypothetical protein